MGCSKICGPQVPKDLATPLLCSFIFLVGLGEALPFLPTLTDITV